MSSLVSSSSSHCVPYTICHTPHGAVRVHGQCGNRTAQQEEGDPFIFNEGMYRVSHLWWHRYMSLGAEGVLPRG